MGPGPISWHHFWPGTIFGLAPFPGPIFNKYWGLAPFLKYWGLAPFLAPFLKTSLELSQDDILRGPRQSFCMMLIIDLKLCYL